MLSALGKQWHPEHFVCKVCEKPITGSTFNEKDGHPVCSPCFIQKFSQICFSCKKPIQEVSKCKYRQLKLFQPKHKKNAA